MVAVDSSTGIPVRISGAALAGGPTLALAGGRRLESIIRRQEGSGFSSLLSQSAAPPARPAPAADLAPLPNALPAQWGIPTYYARAPYGPPYELPPRTAEWELSAETVLPFLPVNQQARMAQRVHPRGPILQTAGNFLAALYGATPTPRYLGAGINVVR